MAEVNPEEARELGDFDRLIEQAYRELETSRKIAQGIVSNARDEAEEMMVRAKSQAARLVAEARERARETFTAESDRLLAEAKAAYGEGFQQGMQQGSAEGQRQFDAILAKVSSIMDQLSRERSSVIESCRGEMIELVLKIAERVIRLEKETVRKLLGENLRLLLEESTAKDETVLHLNPIDLPEVTRFLGEHSGPLPRHRISSDPGVPAGECRVRGKSLNLDLSFARRFEAIRDRIQSRLADASRPGLKSVAGGE